MITEEQQERRKSFVGASEIGAIIGTDPYRNSTDLFLQKTGRLPAFEGNEATRRGTHLEGAILSLFEAEHQLRLARNIWVQGDEYCAATLDGVITDESDVLLDNVQFERNAPRPMMIPVEAKSSNFGRDWNQETGAIPEQVLVQVQFQLYCSGPQCTHGFVPALVPEFQRFKFLSPVPIVKRDDELIEELRIAAHDFMAQVKADVQPEPLAHLESLKRMRREPACISLGDEAAEIWEQYAAAGDREKGAHTDREGFKQQILAVLGDSEAGRLPDGQMITFLEQNGGRQCDLDRLQILAPDLYEQLVSQGRHRVLRIKKARVGKR